MCKDQYADSAVLDWEVERGPQRLRIDLPRSRLGSFALEEAGVGKDLFPSSFPRVPISLQKPLPMQKEKHGA